MNKMLRPQNTAGSITPHLEGAAQSLSHPERATAPLNSQADKGGNKHE